MPAGKTRKDDVFRIDQLNSRSGEMEINIKDFSMAEFLVWLGENHDKIILMSLEQVDCIATCEIKMKDKGV